MDPKLTLALRNFRAFAKTDEIRIKPLTVLVGENSTGKTSFLAALRFALSLSDREKRGYFNVYPFDLGSFDDIAYDSPGRGPSKSFSITIDKQTDIRDSSIYFSPDDKSKAVLRCRLEVDFCSSFGDVSIASFKFSFGNLSAVFNSKAENLFEFYSGRSRILGSRAHSVPERSRRETGDFGLRGLSFLMMEELLDYRGSGNRQHMDERRRIAQVFDAFISPGLTVHSSPPVRSIPKRVYTTSDDLGSGEIANAPYELNRVKRSDQKRWSRLNAGLNRYGKEAGLFTRFDVTKLTPQDSGPFQLKVKVRGRSSTIADVGYGVSQSLPLMTDLVEANEGKHAFLFQQPEVHLHPRAQAALGSIFADYVSAHSDCMIVAETHSDYLIDRLRIAVREGAIEPASIGILYFDASRSNVGIHQIELDASGNILKAPKTYREFFIREQERVLGF
jgi:hypothetical protein